MSAKKPYSSSGRHRTPSFGTTAVSLLLSLAGAVDGRNIAITSNGIAVATRGPEDGLTIFDAPRGKQEDHDVLMMGGRNFNDVTIDPFATGKKQFVFVLSVASRRVCSLQLLNEGGYFFGPVGCAATELSVSPYTGISAKNGTLVVSGGTGGMSVFAYDTETGVIDDPPAVLDEKLEGVIGHPDVTLISPTLVALSTDFATGFGTLIVSIVGSNVDSLRNFVVKDSVGLDFALAPANFPLVNAIYYDGGGGTFMYTANGPITVQDPTHDGDGVIVEGAPNGFKALTVAVNSEKERVVFGGVMDDGTSLLVLFDVADPLQATYIGSQDVETTGGRITSVATSGDYVVYVAEDLGVVRMIDLNADWDTGFSAASPLPTKSPVQPSQPQPSGEPPVGVPSESPVQPSQPQPFGEPPMGGAPPTSIPTVSPTVSPHNWSSSQTEGSISGSGAYSVRAVTGLVLVGAAFCSTLL